MTEVAIKTKIQAILLHTLSPLGRLLWWLIFRQESHEVFLILPHFHVAGAEMIHVQIAESLRGEKLCIVFTRKSPSSGLRARFAECGRIVDLSGWEQNPILAAIAAGLLAQWSNKSAQPRIFASNSFLFFKILRLVGDRPVCIDLTHSFDGGMEVASLSVAARIDKRIVIHTGLVEQFKELYQRAGLDQSLLTRLTVISNRTEAPESIPRKEESATLVVLYVGRDTPEKRAHLVAHAAAIAIGRSDSYRFIVAGRFNTIRWPAGVLNCGEISNREQMLALYSRADVVLLPSSREGMPLAILEGMVHGAVPVCTPVGDLPNHIVHGENGILIRAAAEDEIILEIVASLEMLQSDIAFRQRLANRAYEYARRHFAGSCGPEYRRIILESQRAA